jgi:hypothetical protein
VGAVVKQKLEVIVYDGTAPHDFPRYRDRVERPVASMRLQ